MSKRDVAYTMLRYIELHIDKIQKATGREIVITYLFGEILDRMQQLQCATLIEGNNKKISSCQTYIEAVIVTCMDMLRWLDTKVYDKVLKPCEYVLPITDTDNLEKVFEGCDFYDKEDTTMEFTFTHFATKDELEKYIKDNELEYNN